LAREDLAPYTINLENNPDYPAVRRVRIKASAGIAGYAVERMDEDGPPIVFRADWFKTHGYRPDKLVAMRVCGQSMEPSLHQGDLIVVNTEAATPKDGVAFVVLYEGVVAVKRLVRDSGAWWLESDNADKRAYPRKACTDDTTKIVGQVVYKQSEWI
jgi:phage repressor protein C with HTH and peptisase S24 domain